MTSHNNTPGDSGIPRCPCHRILMRFTGNVQVQGIRIGLYACAMGAKYADYGKARDDDNAAVLEPVA